MVLDKMVLDKMVLDKTNQLLGKKKPKMKGTKMNLTEFLSDEKGGGGGPVMAGKIDWAAEMETSNDVEDFDDIQYGRPSIDRSKLPTAPKASRGPDVDPSRIPNNPPFTAFIGNLPYDTTADKIEQFFQKLNVLNVRLPSDQGRMKGFGYVEFGDKQSLIDALLLNDEVLSGRKVRVDLAGQNQQNDQRSGGGFGRERQNEGPDRTEGDWRRGPPPESEFDRGGDRYGDRGGDRYGDRGGDRGGDRYGDRGGDRYGDRGGDRYGNRDGDRYGDRGGDRYGDRGGDRYGDRRGSDRWGSRDEGRGFDRDDRDGGSRGYDRGSSYRDRNRDYDDRRPSRGYDDRGQRDRYEDDRGPQRDRYDDRGPPRDRYDDRGPQRDRYDDRGPPRDRYDNRRGYDRRDGGGYGRDRYDDRERRGGFGSGYRRDDRQRSPETPAERPRLNLQPRTKPIEEPAPEGKPSEGKLSEDKPSEGNAPKATPPKPSSASIFGGAKPVDTAAREREIEERLQKQRLEEAKKLEEEKENRYVNNPSADRGYRKRRDSENSQEDGYSGSRRERRLSSGSSSKGRSGPPPVTSSRSRKDSNTSNHSQEVFSGGEGDKDEPKSPVSPSSSNDQPRFVKYLPGI
ncbi:hypothetical protein FSP39_001213 [Pinctada imbricata]|uniref:RRM domain-containing protein n=1 Tax=Pinctada imbricata TaxID=66713 RepID=A0AA88YQD4_PINIB|nr:hypothetical protein FSP39_001213 [Pinctada imbricata]